VEKILVSVQGVSKSFGRTQALTDVSVHGMAGSIHAITGENGAGKSTLMKILAGVYLPDAGAVTIAGRPVVLKNPHAARQAGISTVFQELTIIPNLTVAENLCLGREPTTRWGALDTAARHRTAAAVLQDVGLDLDPQQGCAALSIAQRQMLEIAKGVLSKAEIFIFDEPTAPLNRLEVDALARILARLKASGALVFYISHRLEEIFRFSDVITVLKDGRLVQTVASHSINERELVKLMVGRDIQAMFPPRRKRLLAQPALQVLDLQVAKDAPKVSFRLDRTEILGIAGLEGHGQREIIRALSGAIKPLGGHMLIGGDGVKLNCLGRSNEVVAHGVALAPEDRKSEGLYLELSVRENIALGLLRKLALWRGALDGAQATADSAEKMQLRGAADDSVASLSGGNQQKIMLGRWLVSGVDVLLVEQPTRGVDVGAKSEIYALLRNFADQGHALLVVSGDANELIGLCDRILVVRNGAIVADQPAETFNEESIVALSMLEADHSAQGRAVRGN